MPSDRNFSGDSHGETKGIFIGFKGFSQSFHNDVILLIIIRSFTKAHTLSHTQNHPKTSNHNCTELYKYAWRRVSNINNLILI